MRNGSDSLVELLMVPIFDWELISVFTQYFPLLIFDGNEARPVLK